MYAVPEVAYQLYGGEVIVIQKVVIVASGSPGVALEVDYVFRFLNDSKHKTISPFDVVHKRKAEHRIGALDIDKFVVQVVDSENARLSEVRIQPNRRADKSWADVHTCNTASTALGSEVTAGANIAP